MSSDNNISLIEMTKTYKKIKKNNNISTYHIDDTFDRLNMYMSVMANEEHTKSINELDKNEFIERKLKETMCICSILFGIEYDRLHTQST